MHRGRNAARRGQKTRAAINWIPGRVIPGMPHTTAIPAATLSPIEHAPTGRPLN